jgi:hypothetical protein
MWLLDEDYALKQKLEGGDQVPPTALQVTNYVDGKKFPVTVYYRSPDPEQRTRTFPHFQIDLTDVEPDASRTHRSGAFVVPFPTEMATPASGYTLIADDMPLPWQLIYQITAMSRDPWHDRQLAMWMYVLFPNQFGFLNMGSFDGTTRRADLIGHTRRDIPADNDRKRLFRLIFTVSISSEFYLDQIQTVRNVIEGGVNTTVEEFGQYVG